ncbi:RND transporter, partial [Pseudomonas sp. GW531-E2]
LTHVRASDQDTAEQRRVVAGLRETVRLNQVRVSTGLGSQLDTIDAGFRLLEAEQALVSLQSDAFTHRIQLIAALGGGFQSSPPPAAAHA